MWTGVTPPLLHPIPSSFSWISNMSSSGNNKILLFVSFYLFLGLYPRQLISLEQRMLVFILYPPPTVSYQPQFHFQHSLVLQWEVW